MTHRATAGRFRRSIVGVTALVAVGGAALTGCGSDGGSGKDGGSGSGVHGAADPARIPSMMLTADDLPSGYHEQEMPKSQFQDVLDQMSGTVRDADIQPAACGDLSAMPENLNPDEMEMLVAIRGDSPTDAQTLAAVVSIAEVDLAAVRDKATGECSRITAKFVVEGQDVTSSSRTEVLDAPDTDADATLVFRQRTNTSVADGLEMDSESIAGFAQIGGYNLTVQFVALGGEVDQAEFDRFFTEAVDKAIANA